MPRTLKVQLRAQQRGVGMGRGSGGAHAQGSALRAGEMFPVTRELQLVSMSVGPRYSRAVLVK